MSENHMMLEDGKQKVHLLELDITFWGKFCCPLCGVKNWYLAYESPMDVSKCDTEAIRCWNCDEVLYIGNLDDDVAIEMVKEQDCVMDEDGKQQPG